MRLRGQTLCNFDKDMDKPNLYRYQSLHFQLDGYIARKVPGQGKMKKIILEFTLDVIELSRDLFQLQNWAVFWTLWLTKYW